ncbi:MAG TPA: Asd/ArgC dimerization domain-containing protein [Candidatus Acidoferrum sp.]|nr:Asd/ArgC dimerization domain-containing protein [Candidatus Acidoferrum sp.]
MASPLQSRRIVIAGASSLLGAELKTLLEQSRFAASEFRLVDEEAVAAILTEAAGEPAIILPVEEDSFNKAWIVFFAGSPAFSKRNLSLAKKSGARIVDLSGEFAGHAEGHRWLPKFDDLTGTPFNKDASIFVVPSAAAEIIARLAIALRPFALGELSAVTFQSASSSAGKSGVQELESQTGQLLSFQPLGKEVFDTQAAFTMLDRFGAASRHNLQTSLDILRREVHSCLPDDIRTPALQLLHAPVYYGTTVTACAQIEASADAATLVKSCASAGFSITTEDAAPDNISSAGEISLQLAPPRPDPSSPGTWWFWASADNLRLPAANALKLAERLLA